jgi:CMP-N-acetylneuraminic acid synthetase
MKAIIPAKASSSRVPNKNFRPFYQGQSLLDLTIRKLLAYLSAGDIYVSSEEANIRSHADKWGVGFIHRSDSLIANDTPQIDVVPGVCAPVPGEDDIMWCQVIDPLFDEYGPCLERWGTVSDEADSLVVVYPRHGFYLDERFRPDGFGFGPWHISSQQLPPRYQLTFVLSILKRSTINRVRYYIGERPHWYLASSPPTDIDTEQDFELAQAIYHFFEQQRESSSRHDPQVQTDR